MKIVFHKKFVKDYYRCDKKTRVKFEEHIKRFRKNPFDARLNNHRLQGTLKSFYSINVTGNVRAIYRVVEENIVEFMRMDTHGNLYG